MAAKRFAEYKEIGDPIQKEDVVLQVETSTTILEIESEVEGVLADICHDAGEEVTTATLIARKLVDPTHGGVKLLGRGDLTKKLIEKVQAVSPGARVKFEAVGGTVECITLAKE